MNHRGYMLPEPGDDYINVEDVENAIEDYESVEENEHGEFEVPFDPELYIALKDLWTGGDAGHWYGLEGYNYDQLIHEDHFVEYIKQLIDDCYEDWPTSRKSRRGWPYDYVTVDYEGAAEAAKEDYTEVTFGGHMYYAR